MTHEKDPVDQGQVLAVIGRRLGQTLGCGVAVVTFREDGPLVLGEFRTGPTVTCRGSTCALQIHPVTL